MISVEVDPQTDIYENFMCISDNLAMAEMADNTVLPNLFQGERFGIYGSNAGSNLTNIQVIIVFHQGVPFNQHSLYQQTQSI